MNAIQWETTGGGAIAFTVQVGCDGALMIHVSREDFGAQDLWIPLPVAHLQEKDLATLLGVCTGKLAPEVVDHEPDPARTDRDEEMLCTGTWTHLYLKRGAQRVEIRDSGVFFAMSAVESIARSVIRRGVT